MFTSIETCHVQWRDGSRSHCEGESGGRQPRRHPGLRSRQSLRGARLTRHQLETAAGSAMKHFSNAHGIHVPRSRFLPVKTCSDLLLIKSDLYSLQNGRLVLSTDRMFATIPVIKLGDHYKRVRVSCILLWFNVECMRSQKVAEFQERFKQMPHIMDLDHLTITGDVHFGRNITLRGTVISKLRLLSDVLMCPVHILRSVKSRQVKVNASTFHPGAYWKIVRSLISCLVSI